MQDEIAEVLRPFDMAMGMGRNTGMVPDQVVNVTRLFCAHEVSSPW
jgi:hypothetical protein